MFLRFGALVLALSSAVPALADSYTIYTDTTDSYSLLGINAAGQVLTAGASSFATYDQGIRIYSGTTIPTFISDNGHSCASPVIAGFSTLGLSVCNGGFQVYHASNLATGMGAIFEITPTSSLIGNLVMSGSIDQLAVNGSGDFAVTNGQQGYLYEVRLTQTPEPETLALTLTGVLGGVATTIRYRRVVSA